MLASDIINHLVKYLPRLTDLFSTSIPVSTFTIVGDTITIQFSQNHNLTTGDKIMIYNASVDIPITSMVKNGNLITATTSSDHDLTQGYQNTITINNSSISALNSTFTLTGVPNRRSFQFSSTIDISSGIGSPNLLMVYEDNPINDYHTVTVIDSTTITITVANNSFTNIDVNVVKVVSSIRISGASNLERLIEAYEASNTSNYWLYVVLDDYQTGKARSSPLDANQNVANLNAWNIEQLANFSTYVFIPSTNSLTGRTARDVAETLRASLYKILINSSFDTGLTGGSPMSNVSPISDNIAGYSKAYYIHQYQWQQVNQVTGFDVFPNYFTVAFRNLENDIQNNNNIDIIEDNYNLDGEIL